MDTVLLAPVISARSFINTSLSVKDSRSLQIQSHCISLSKNYSSLLKASSSSKSGSLSFLRPGDGQLSPNSIVRTPQFELPRDSREGGWSSHRRHALAERLGEQTANIDEVVIDSDLLRKSDEYFAVDERPVILFDGVCNLCNAGVNFVLDNDSTGKLRFAALQSPAGSALLVRSGRSPGDISSIVLVEKTRSYVRSEAVLRIARNLNMPFPVLAAAGIVTPSFARDLLYEWVADNRYNLLGERNSCRFSDDGFRDRFVQ